MSAVKRPSRGGVTWRTAAIVALVLIVSACESGGTSSPEPRPSDTPPVDAPGTNDTPSPSTSPPEPSGIAGPACKREQPTAEQGEVLVYFPCAATFRPVVVDAGEDPWPSAIDAIERGPDREMRGMGFYPATGRETRFTIVRRGQRVIVDIESSSIDVPIFLESTANLGQSLELTLEGIAEQDLTLVTLIDGKGLCAQPEAQC